MVILVLVLVAVATAALVAAAIVPPVRQRLARPAPAAAAPEPPAATGPDSIEGVLVRQLADGAIDRLQYLRAMEFIARRDAECHPMAVPSDD